VRLRTPVRLSDPSGHLPIEIRLGSLDRGKLGLDLAQPGEVGLALVFGKRALGCPEFRM
jgi:hypothetical protein